MARGLSEVVTEYVQLQNVSWLNMACGLWPNMVCGPSEDTTEFVPLQNVSWQTLGRPKIHENESKTYYLTPLYHFIGMRSDFERNNFSAIFD